MTDLDAIRARHVPASRAERFCAYCSADWPCDTAVVLAAWQADMDAERGRTVAAEDMAVRWQQRLEAAEAREARLRADPCEFCDMEHVWPCPTIPRCDEPGCERQTSCGFPTEAGYRRTCGEHYQAALATEAE